MTSEDISEIRQLLEDKIAALIQLLNEHYTHISVEIARGQVSLEGHEKRIGALETFAINSAKDISEARGAMRMLLIIIPIAIGFTGLVVAIAVRVIK